MMEKLNFKDSDVMMIIIIIMVITMKQISFYIFSQ